MGIMIKKSEATGNWIKGRDSGGLATTVSWADLERLLRNDGRLRDNEHIDRIRIEETLGLTCFIENK